MSASAPRAAPTDGRGARCYRGARAEAVLALHRVLHRALGLAVRWQLLSRNPADAVEPPRQERAEPRLLDAEAVRAIIDAVEATPYGALVYTAAMTGARRGELVALTWAALDLDGAAITVRASAQRLTGRGVVVGPPKTKRSSRTIALSPATVERLRAHRRAQLEERLLIGPAYADRDLVFATPTGTPLDPSNLRRAWLAIVRGAGLPGVRFHDLRHAHAALLLRQGVAAKTIADRLGHSSIRVTMDAYAGVLPDVAQDAAAQLDRLLTGTMR